LGGTLFFLASSLKQHWTEVADLRVDAVGWAMLIVALGTTLMAHIWTGWVWSWILRELNQPASGVWGILVYLKTNIAKYLPGNVWHLYGRVIAAKQAGFSTGAVTLSVLLEPLLMAAAALTIALSSLQSSYWVLQALSLAIVLTAIHPRLLNPLLKLSSRIKGKPAPVEIADGERQNQGTQEAESRHTAASHNSPPPTPPSSPLPPSSSSFHLKRYPLLPLLGELIFVLLRGLGFLLTVWVLSPVNWVQLPIVLSAFSLAWVLGLIIPGAPGGIGVFEATAIALLQAQFPPAVVLGSVALYRLISTLAEAGGAGLAWLDDQYS
jgi:uncharacterized membrane protein YbhN (UPF0104 family)